MPLPSLFGGSFPGASSAASAGSGAESGDFSGTVGFNPQGINTGRQMNVPPVAIVAGVVAVAVIVFFTLRRR